MGSHNKIALPLNLGALLYGQEVGPADAFSLLLAVLLVYPCLCIHSCSILQNTPFLVTFLGQRDLKKFSVEKSQSSVKHTH